MNWTVAAPVLAFAVLILTWGRHLPVLLIVIVAGFLAGAVLAAVHHAEVVAQKVGEPFGSLVLAVAVTVIEVGLIVTLMAGGGHRTHTLARDTVFAAVMITCNGIVGLSRKIMLHSRLTEIPAITDWNTVAKFDYYAEAQQAVDRLSDDGFPVEQLDIVGSDLRLIERVTGRLTNARAAGAGALSGIWIGLLIGILLGLFAPGHAWLVMVAAGIGFGGLWGAAFGFAAHRATRGRRDFRSVRALAATHYDVIARGTRHAEQPRNMLASAGLLAATA